MQAKKLHLCNIDTLIAFSFKSLDSSFSNQLFPFKDLVPNKDWIL